ncbi:hypothetical protein ACJX0J_040148, partial [Zea mays]
DGEDARDRGTSVLFVLSNVGLPSIKWDAVSRVHYASYINIHTGTYFRILMLNLSKGKDNHVIDFFFVTYHLFMHSFFWDLIMHIHVRVVLLLFYGNILFGLCNCFVTFVQHLLKTSTQILATTP